MKTWVAERERFAQHAISEAMATKRTCTMPKREDEYFEDVRSRSVQPPQIAYKYACADTATEILSRQTLQFSSPLLFNDPFDIQWNLLWQLGTSQATELLRDLVERYLRGLDPWPNEADPNHKEVCERLCANITKLPAKEREAVFTASAAKFARQLQNGSEFTKVEHDIRRRLRVACLSARADSILMWSHYAQHHTGVVLGFDTSSLESALRRPLEQVLYSDELPRLIDPEEWCRTVLYGLPAQHYVGRGREWALTKHTGWRYEEEWRFVLLSEKGAQDNRQYREFPGASLAEIMLGCRIDEQVRDQLLAKARSISPSVQCFQMFPHRSRFQLEKVRVAGS